MNKPRRVRIYKLSTFDTFTKKERDLHEAYKSANKNKTLLKQIRDDEITKYEGIRKIDRSKLYTYEYDKDGKVIVDSEEENTDKQIALFESEMARYATEFKEKVPLVMEIVYMKIDHQDIILNQILENGLYIDGKKYIFFTSTTNQMKRGEIVLVQEEFFHTNDTKFMCGLTEEIINEKGGCNRGKYLAYKGLPLSSSVLLEDYEINIENCLVVSDFETIVNEEVECIDIDHDKRKIIGLEKRIEEITVPHTDGCGMFLPGVLPASAQIRCGHLKGALFPFDFRKFLLQEKVEGIKPSPIIRDAWGKIHNVIEEDIKVILTASQLKMWKYYNSWDDYKEAFTKNSMKIAINKFADTNPKGWVKSSYQFLQTLSSEKLTDEMIENLCKDTIEYLDKMKTDVDTMIDIMGEDYVTDTMKVYPSLIQDSYVQDRVEDKFRRERTEARGGKLILKDSLYSYICPDLFAFCTWLFCGIQTPKGIIPRNYVYNSFYNDKDYEIVDCLRSPHLYVEHGIRNLVKGEVLDKCKEWFNDFDTIVSNHDVLCRLLMFDVDGDEVLLTPNKYIIDCVPDNVIPLYYKAFEAEKAEITTEVIFEALVASMENSNIGDISNIMTKNYNNDDTDMEFNKIMCCFNNLTIDFPKTQKNIELGEWQEKYESLKKEKNPYFFIYAKDKNKANCKDKSSSNVDRICNYIHKKTGNKQYKWKNTDGKFDPSILFNQNFKVDIKSEKYSKLEELMFELRKREVILNSAIKEAVKEVSKSDGEEMKHSKYDIFYYVCEKMINHLFSSREEAAEYLLDLEYLQRDNEDKSKNILWNCYGDLIYSNVCTNVKRQDQIHRRRKRYKIGSEKIEKIAKKVPDKIKEFSKTEVPVTKVELEWIDEQKYKCDLDRELLYILLVLQKAYDGAVIISNKKNGMTCNKIDKWLGDGVCVCKNGLFRLQDLKLITIEVKGRNLKIEVNTPKFKDTELAFMCTVNRNPLIPFYKNNEERKVVECAICKKEFIKIKNRTTCSPECSNEQDKRRKRKSKTS